MEAGVTLDTMGEPSEQRSSPSTFKTIRRSVPVQPSALAGRSAG
jgi:hypothetical protein